MATDLEKLMAQMPNLGAEMPTLTGNANPLAMPTTQPLPLPQAGPTLAREEEINPFIRDTNLPQALSTLDPTQVPQADGGGNVFSRGFDFMFGNPTPEQARQTLEKQPTDPAQRERLQSIIAGDAAPSDVSQARSFLFGRPENAGDPNILGAPEPKIEDPFGVTQEQIQAAGNASFGQASPMLSSGSMGTVPFDPTLPVPQVPQGDVAGAQGALESSIQPDQASPFQTPTAQGLTTAVGQPLAEFLAGGQQLDAQGRMIDPNVDRSSFDQESMLRDQRQEKMLQDRAQSRQDQRGGATGELSMADAVDMAGGDRDKARALVVQSRQGAGKEPLTFDQQMKVRAQNLAEGKFEYQLSKDTTEAFDAGVAATKDATTEEARAETAGKTMTSAIGNMNDAMSRMGGRSGEFFGSGFFGKAASFLPGTSAYDQVADTEFLQSNVALNTMAELKDLSPTGSTGFGALSEKELGVLTNKYANLNPFTSPELFQKNLQQLSKEFNNMLDNAWSKHSKQYDEASANAIYGNRGGGEPAPASTGTTVNYEGSGYSIVQ